MAEDVREPEPAPEPPTEPLQEPVAAPMPTEPEPVPRAPPERTCAECEKWEDGYCRWKYLWPPKVPYWIEDLVTHRYAKKQPGEHSPVCEAFKRARPSPRAEPEMDEAIAQDENIDVSGERPESDATGSQSETGATDSDRMA